MVSKGQSCRPAHRTQRTAAARRPNLVVKTTIIDGQTGRSADGQAQTTRMPTNLPEANARRQQRAAMTRPPGSPAILRKRSGRGQERRPPGGGDKQGGSSEGNDLSPPGSPAILRKATRPLARTPTKLAEATRWQGGSKEGNDLSLQGSPAIHIKATRPPARTLTESGGGDKQGTAKRGNDPSSRKPGDPQRSDQATARTPTNLAEATSRATAKRATTCPPGSPAILRRATRPRARATPI